MNIKLSSKLIPSAIILLTILFISNKAAAETNVKIQTSTGNNEIKVENNSNVTSDSTCDTSVKNYIEVNGEIVVDEDSVKPCAVDSEVNVNIKNNEGTVKYKVNGEEKTINITPKQNESNTDKTSTVEAKEKTDVDEEKVTANSDANFMTKLIKNIENFFKKIASLLS